MTVTPVAVGGRNHDRAGEFSPGRFPDRSLWRWPEKRLTWLFMQVSLGCVAEKLDRLAAERGKVVRVAAGYQALVDDDLAIDPVSAGVREIGP